MNVAVGTRDDDRLMISDRSFASRLLLGTAGYPNQSIMLQALNGSQVEMVTLSIRRADASAYAESLIDLLRKDFFIIPNTAGCSTVRDAVLTAELAREALGTNWIKLELIGDRETLHPDVHELVVAVKELVRKGFVVLPYCTDDLVTCSRLIDVGASAVMPLGAPIGTGQGILNPYSLALLTRRCSVPVLMDAGIGTASDAALAMELGCAGVLLNTAVARAKDPKVMAVAMARAVQAGRLAYMAGRIPRRTLAEASSPQLGLIGS